MPNIYKRNITGIKVNEKCSFVEGSIMCSKELTITIRIFSFQNHSYTHLISFVFINCTQYYCKI